jgi:3'(2'), 5'-bisphosphate nucleotidase
MPMMLDLVDMPSMLQAACHRRRGGFREVPGGFGCPIGAAAPRVCRSGSAFVGGAAPYDPPPMNPARAPAPDLQSAVDSVVPAMPIARLLGETLASVPPVEKGDGSPVTAADYVLQAIVVAGLRARSADGRVPLLGEEHADALVAARRPDVERLVVDAIRSALGWRTHADALRAIDGDEPRAGEPHWTIDPIDGTKGFLLGAQCSICLARIEGRDVTVGVLGCPRMGPRGDLAVHPQGPGVIYGASLGGGAFEFDAAGAAVGPLPSVSWRGGPVRWARSLNRSRNPQPSRLAPLLEALGPVTSDYMDSQCKYALVARGDADLVVRLPRSPGHHECIWDHASGALIAAEAGANVTDAAGRALDFSHGELLAANSGILCAVPGLAGGFTEAVGALAAGSR